MPTPARSESRLSDDDIRDIAVEAYVYAFPLVLMEITRRTTTNIAAPGHGRAPVNRFGHMVRLPDATFRDVVAPSPDTLNSILWFDVSSEPLIIEMPDSGGRYHLLQILDMWTDVFASPGSRTTGDRAETFAIVGPRWHGTLPNDMDGLVSPTDQGWIIGRTLTNGITDYAAVHEFQTGLTACPLSLYGGQCRFMPNHVDQKLPMSPPLDQVVAMDAAAFFSLFTQLARQNPPHLHDHPILARMARVGLEPGKTFALAELPPTVRDAFAAAPHVAFEQLSTEIFRTGPVVRGWHFISEPIGTYATDYLHRASVACNGLGANLPEDARYAVLTMNDRGEGLSGDSAFVLHFDKTEIPPVRGFWSVTVYNEHRYFADNPMNRYALGDRDPLSFNPDGSLDLFIQRDDPGDGKRANWLPSPGGQAFLLVLRLYWPKHEVLRGDWQPPSLVAAP